VKRNTAISYHTGVVAKDGAGALPSKIAAVISARGISAFSSIVNNGESHRVLGLGTSNRPTKSSKLFEKHHTHQEQ
jgi:hypothetical protein